MPQPAKRGDSVEPGVERGFASGTPGSVEYQVAAREVGDSLFIISVLRRFRCRSARLNLIIVANLGFRPDRSGLHPRLYAIAALRGLRQSN